MKWTKQDLEKFMQLYPLTNTQDLVKIFNRNVSALRTKAHELGIQKTKATMVNMWSRSNSGQFKRGMVAWNKGSKGIMHNGIATRFKKGQIPHNKLPDNIRAITSQLSRLKKNIKEREKRNASQ